MAVYWFIECEGPVAGCCAITEGKRVASRPHPGGKAQRDAQVFASNQTDAGCQTFAAQANSGRQTFGSKAHADENNGDASEDALSSL